MKLLRNIEVLGPIWTLLLLASTVYALFFFFLKVVSAKKDISVDEDEVLEVELPPPMKIQDHSFTPVHQGLPGSLEKVSI